MTWWISVLNVSIPLVNFFRYRIFSLIKSISQVRDTVHACDVSGSEPDVTAFMVTPIFLGYNL